MPVTPRVSYPGVYVAEIPSGVRTITGVATSIAAFIGDFRRGPLNKAVQIFNPGDLVREFGDLYPLSEAGYAIQQFFLNGGSEAWVVRTASADSDNPLSAATVVLSNGSQNVLTIAAISPGIWGDSLRVSVDYDTSDPATLFNLTVAEYSSDNPTGLPLQTEVFRNLSMDSSQSNFVKDVINDENGGSRLVRVGDDISESADGSTRPLQNGTTSADLSGFAQLTAQLSNTTPAVNVVLDGGQPVTAVFKRVPAATLQDVRVVLESAIRSSDPANSALSRATVEITSDNRLRVLVGPTDGKPIITFDVTDDDDTTAEELGLTTEATANVQEYTLGGGAITDTGQTGGDAGSSGLPSDAAALIGDRNEKAGIFALEDVDLFNILCIPDTAKLDVNEAFGVLTQAITYCAERRAMMIVDPPEDEDDVQEIKAWKDAIPRGRNAAIYYPRVLVPDPENEFRLRSFGASGTMAGVWARTDGTRGVWKAPAGIDATLAGVRAIAKILTDAENGTLNPFGINCLRSFPVYGRVAWGARTLDGADILADEYKYIPVRRLALFIEESLFRGLKWVVFEPNDEPLWAQIRLNVGAFMNNLFRQGAFQGSAARDAYFVKCDKETTTQNDINLGIVNIVVGFAPLKPAEFVIIYLQQMAGQIEV